MRGLLGPFFDQFGKPEIDLFANHLNTKCTKHASYKPAPEAYHVNAFSLFWLKRNSYIFPSFSIVRKVPPKLAQDWARALGIVLCWQAQPYHVHVFSLCWLKLNSYIFPSFRMVGKVLAKLVQDQGRALVIISCWQTQP